MWGNIPRKHKKRKNKKIQKKIKVQNYLPKAKAPRESD